MVHALVTYPNIQLSGFSVGTRIPEQKANTNHKSESGRQATQTVGNFFRLTFLFAPHQESVTDAWLFPVYDMKSLSLEIFIKK